jgi:hypothetical protein
LPSAFFNNTISFFIGKVINLELPKQKKWKLVPRSKLLLKKWLNANGQAGYLNDYRWEYKLVDDKAVNACMPGGSSLHRNFTSY